MARLLLEFVSSPDANGTLEYAEHVLLSWTLAVAERRWLPSRLAAVAVWQAAHILHAHRRIAPPREALLSGLAELIGSDLKDLRRCEADVLGVVHTDKLIEATRPAGARRRLSPAARTSHTPARRPAGHVRCRAQRSAGTGQAAAGPAQAARYGSCGSDGSYDRSLNHALSPIFSAPQHAGAPSRGGSPPWRMSSSGAPSRVLLHTAAVPRSG